MNTTITALFFNYGEIMARLSSPKITRAISSDSEFWRYWRGKRKSYLKEENSIYCSPISPKFQADDS